MSVVEIPSVENDNVVVRCDDDSVRTKKRLMTVIKFLSIGIAGVGFIAFMNHLSSKDWKKRYLELLSTPDEFPNSRLRFVKREPNDEDVLNFDAPLYALQLFYTKPNPVENSDFKFRGEWGSNNLEDILEIRELIDDFEKFCKGGSNE